MLRTIKFYCIVLFFFLGQTSFAQDSVLYKVKVIARATKDSIMLRWAPVNYESWRLGLKNGYIVERYTMVKDGKLQANKKKIILTGQPVKPSVLSVWEKLADTDDYAGIAAQAIYGDDFDVQVQGSPVINIFNRASVQQNRYSFALFAADHSSDVARAMGLWYTDRNIVKGEKYLYRVYFAGIDNSKNDTAFVFTAVDEMVPLQKPVFSEIEGNDLNIALSWRGPGGRNSYTSFELQRSDDGGSTFFTLNSSPLINTYETSSADDQNFYMDTISRNNFRYVYRVRGTTPFGDKGPFSDTISASGKEKLKEVPHIIKHFSNSQGVTLKWEFSSKSEDQIRNFQILRSTESNKDFKPVSNFIDKKAREFTDAKPLGTAYYLIEANGKNGEKLMSFPVLVQLIDSVPPLPPLGLTALADTSGKVLLKWNANREQDIYGYRIYRGNSANEEFSQITVRPVQDTFFVDQIKVKTLSKKVYYRLMAIDQRQNHSPLSEVFEIKRPDIVPPASPVVTNISSSPDGICITWILSTSEDVVRQLVLRKASTSDWEKLGVCSDSIDKFCDTTALPGAIYQYAVQSEDESGLRSPVGVILSGKRQESQPKLMLIGKGNQSNSTINLSWTGVSGNGRFILYRAEGEKPLSTYQAFPNTQNSFTDKKVSPATQYRYLVKYTDNSILAVSEEIVVKY